MQVRRIPPALNREAEDLYHVKFHKAHRMPASGAGSQTDNGEREGEFDWVWTHKGGIEVVASEETDEAPSRTRCPEKVCGMEDCKVTETG